MRISGLLIQEKSDYWMLMTRVNLEPQIISTPALTKLA
jgi:hypothetical protein